MLIFRQGKITFLGGGQFAPELPGQFAPAEGGHFVRPDLVTLLRPGLNFMSVFSSSYSGISKKIVLPSYVAPNLIARARTSWKYFELDLVKERVNTIKLYKNYKLLYPSVNPVASITKK